VLRWGGHPPATPNIVCRFRWSKRVGQAFLLLPNIQAWQAGAFLPLSKAKGQDSLTFCERVNKKQTKCHLHFFYLLGQNGIKYLNHTKRVKIGFFCGTGGVI